MITLTLLHPVQGTAVQSWTFKQNETVRIGRAVDNEVVLYSAVVSRHHVELRHENGRWFVHNLGINGTFLEGEKIESEPLQDGFTIRLARSGPNIQVHIEKASPSSNNVSEQEIKMEDLPKRSIPRKTQIEYHPEAKIGQEAENTSQEDLQASQAVATKVCTHERSPQSSLICIDCGEPMNVIKTIGDYKVLKILGDRKTTFQAWKHKKTFILRTLPQELATSVEAKQSFQTQLAQINELNYGGIPRILEIIQEEDQDYLVYEMVYGTSLEKWVKDRGALSVPSAISWITEIARTLEYLHQMETPFIHQSVKPSNIIRPTIPQGDHPLLLVNFGQCQNIQGFVANDGDLAYQSPNKTLGHSSIPDDLYGLGATFLFMLTGSDPYKYIQLGDQSFALEVDDTVELPDAVLEVIRSLLQSEGATPITSATEAIDKFVHLM